MALMNTSDGSARFCRSLVHLSALTGMRHGVGLLDTFDSHINDELMTASVNHLDALADQLGQRYVYDFPV
ncbi:hypothetical protein KIN20_013321 [Parelaphostrongylus tenuis]|uniref:Uncharacterized protein n=1 Tax=Parelaphostrongylus tenuis TaxID=148309 RepID=A0AAD5QNP7_PARTN|nr:hypothetical protein KIN20_013321 [Parelaphostrongylus tenuis]